MRSNPRTRRAAVLAASGIAVAALIAGCGSSGGGSYGSGKAGAPSTSSSPGAPTGATLQAATDPKLGAIVTDSSGFTLYRFDQDRDNPPESSCNGSCATIWPPEHANGDVTVKGIDSKLVGTVTRSDGTKQITLNGRPVYRYSQDAKPGDTKGQGVAGTWFAVTPSGGKAGTGTSAPGPATPSPMNPGPATPSPANPSPMPSIPGY
ncbi:putative lipoprotein with Yx(FWY)xxD motif [Streptomyces sp. 1114.5]|uniref:hypothetical protein n=1 Tax=unclassified Streptomyces TaxID=2593676 RepID=UPI000BC8774E|nr:MULTISPECIES: hypothetical protein [unclassified Streptomyces]RKT18711.1 putative lipoprotein with Yx(FWY)xxD motif [Streptomyces sp. 1114.5]SOB84913.1 Predicted lipoprotein with conserved Yx(FWY)xxD motif [Streptomyces sp. 1331.2]